MFPIQDKTTPVSVLEPRIVLLDTLQHLFVGRLHVAHECPYTLAQAGPSNVNYAHVYDFFPREGT